MLDASVLKSKQLDNTNPKKIEVIETEMVSEKEVN